MALPTFVLSLFGATRQGVGNQRTFIVEKTDHSPYRVLSRFTGVP
jgi:hypothetical protein